MFPKAFIETPNEEIINENDFIIQSLTDDPESPLPTAFILCAICSKYSFKINFTKIQGIVNNPAVDSDVYLGNGDGVERAVTKNLVKIIYKSGYNFIS